VPQTRTNALFAFTFIVISPLSFVDRPRFGSASVRCVSFSIGCVRFVAADSVENACL
jgi:hypothetical protein